MTSTSPSSQSPQPLFSRHRIKNTFRPFFRDKRVMLATILLFASFGVIATLVTNAQEMESQETVVLSDGRSIRLGQTIDTLKASLGDKLFRLNDRQYIYRQKANDPIEAVVDLNNEMKVVVIHLVNKPVNYIKATSSRVGMRLAGGRFYLYTKPLPAAVTNLRMSGVIVEQARSTQYITADNCTSGQQQANLVSLVLKGNESRYIEDLGGPDCVDND